MNKISVLNKYFGYNNFRRGQEEIIDAILSGRDSLGIMPTGGGKSICYQLPALMGNGLTVVVSPLIALMKDQVDALVENGIDATFINSSLSAVERERRYQEIIGGCYKIVYVAPEGLLTGNMFSLANFIDIDMVAIDEAHCISQRGHDFRPSYRGIPEFINRLANKPVVAAFTATATSKVIDDIKNMLALDNPFEMITGFDRENLYYSVVKPSDKFRYLKEYLSGRNNGDTGIIYCSTRKTVESLGDKLSKIGFSVGSYHGGMASEVRESVQDAFMGGNIDIIVATNAFGMGIDKPDVRYVVHYNMPKNMESYYQEAGRAGRDGDPSDCILMYSPADIVKQKLIIAQNESTSDYSRLQLENLQILVNYCHSNYCLRSEILRYFGEESKLEKCNNCGNCNDEIEYIDMTIEAQKILSCIYRVKERYGLNTVIQVLRGSKNKKILDWNLDKVSTYGIASDHSEGALRELAMNLIARGYITMTADKFPILKLNMSSKKIFKNEEKILIRKERVQVKDRIKKTMKRKTDLDFDKKLYDALSEKRKEIANSKGVPLYAVFNNGSLEEMAYYMPIKEEDFLEIKGVGQKKYDSYGKDFIEIINDYITDNEVDKTILENRVKDSYVEVEKIVKESSGLDRYEETYQIYLENLSLEEIANKRGLTAATIVKHFQKLIGNGKEIDWDRFIDKGKEDEIVKARSENPGASLKDIKLSLREEISYTDINLVFAKHGI
ncbi:MAG: DNA helicase RecQ [Firmicutes bacterium]|nr:DNA helicase RecQ [Bacillota bacterium]